MEKMLVTSIFSFSHVFKMLFFPGSLILSQTKVKTTSLDLTIMMESPLKGHKMLWEKEKLLVASNFPFPTEFLTDLYCRHVKATVFLGKSSKSVLCGYNLNPLPDNKIFD